MMKISSVEASQILHELIGRYELCSYYTSDGSKIIGVKGYFCDIRTTDHVEELETLLSWLQKTGLEG
jgi:hypothetical protein